MLVCKVAVICIKINFGTKFPLLVQLNEQAVYESFNKFKFLKQEEWWFCLLSSLFYFFFQQQHSIYKIQEVLLVLLERLALCNVAYPRTWCIAHADLKLSLYLSLLNAEIAGTGHLVQKRKSRFKELLYSFLQHKFKIFEKLSKT